MLEYGETYLEQNQEAITQLSEMLSEAAAEVALVLAPEPDLVAEDQE